MSGGGSLQGSEASEERRAREELESEGSAFAEEGPEELSEEEGRGYTVVEINGEVFDELVLGPDQAEEVQACWNNYLRTAASREMAGEAIYTALFESAPSLQSLFKTPRAIMAMRFMNGLSTIVASLGDSKGLKVVVETLGFKHMDLEVTIPRVAIFREAIVDLLSMELGDQLTTSARDGWTSVLNYVGGAFIYVRLQFTDRLRILASSWAIATNVNIGGKEEGPGPDSRPSSGETEGSGPRSQKGRFGVQRPSKRADAAQREKAQQAHSSNGEHGEGEAFKNIAVPRTFNEMFTFNAAVMGFGSSTWMMEVLESFDTIVTNVSNSYRLQEECDVLALRLAKYTGAINLNEYKAVMLASLRSLVPKDWNSSYEVAWNWLWENVERMLKAIAGRPAQQRKALEKLWGGLEPAQQDFFRREVYSKFFALAPAGQDYFKQSTTRLHFIADRIIAMTLEIYKDPRKMVEDISALGLRHVGYGIPTELFGPFVSACVQVVRDLTEDAVAEEAFRWSVGLISRILVRVITEGSTIVMKAINVNSGKQLRKAVACAPRGERAGWVLTVKVGTHSISPLIWAIETGSLDAAKAIIDDLLTIRADRDQYYYGLDSLVERHPDIIRRLCTDAPALLPVLLDGLIWRSRQTEKGMRRVNYYVKHMIVDKEGNFSKALEWLTDFQDPRIICHPTVQIVTDLVWFRVASRAFLYRKAWLILNLCVFVLSHSILRFLHGGHLTFEERLGNFLCRVYIYLFSMGQLIYTHVKTTVKELREKKVVRVGCLRIPEYLQNWQEVASVLLTLVLIFMCFSEPIFYCLQGDSGDADHDLGLFTEECEAGEGVAPVYSVFSMVGMLLYYSLIVDLTVFSCRVSAFVLVCGRVTVEAGLFMLALAFCIVAFSCAISSLAKQPKDFEGIPSGSLALLEISMGLYNGEHYDELVHYPALLVAAVVYVLCTMVFLLNMLIAQLNSSYQSTYQDMLGYARLNRGCIVVDTMAAVSSRRWANFMEGLHLDQRLEFNEGDLGLPGGLQILEPGNANPTTVDVIRRFGGSTSPSMQWPEHETAAYDEADRFERMEQLLERAMKRITRSERGKKGAGVGSSMGSSGQSKGSKASRGSKGSSAASDSSQM